MDNSEYDQVQDYYNQREEQIERFNKPPFWQLSYSEQAYYRWLMKNDIEYTKLGKHVRYLEGK